MIGRIDQEGIADPMPADEKLSETECPAAASSVAHGLFANVCAVNQQYQRGIAGQKGGKEIQRRETRRRDRAHREGEGKPPPAREARYPCTNTRHAGLRGLGRVTRSLRTRRGSASRIWNSLPSGWATISPRCG